MEDFSTNKKYQDLVETAHHLFWKFGIRRVSIEEICREAKVSKMTCYRFFKNKNAIAIEVIRQMFDKGMADYRAIMNEDIPFSEKIKKQIAMKFEGTNEISSELIKDLMGNPEWEVFKYWNGRKDEIFKTVFADYAEAQQRGLLRKDLKMEFIFHFFGKMMEMAGDPQLQAQYGSMQELIMELTNMYFYGILTPEAHEK